MAHPAQKGFELSLSVQGLQMEEEIVLDKVWTVGRLCLSQDSPLTKEDTANCPHQKGINFPRTQSDSVSANWQRHSWSSLVVQSDAWHRWTLIGQLHSCIRDCYSVNFVCFDDETLHQQMESMFKSDFHKPMISSKVAISAEDRRAYKWKILWRPPSVGLAMMAQVSKPLEQSWICDKKIVLLKEKIPVQLSPLKEVGGYCQWIFLPRLCKKSSLQRTGSCKE